MLMLLEEFKNCCLPSDITTHLHEMKADDLHQAATWVEDYVLTHKGTSKRLPSISGDNTVCVTTTVDQKLPPDNAPLNPSPSLVCQLAQCAITVSIMGMLKPN